MGRPSKLTEKQRAEVQRRHVNGETTRELAKAYKVSQATIATLVVGQTETMQTLAASIVKDERTLESLPVSAQITVRTLADRLRGISDGLAMAASHNTSVAVRLSAMADRKSRLFEIRDTAEVQTELFDAETSLKMVAALVETANRASVIGCNLLSAKKNQPRDGEATLEQLVMGTGTTG